MKFTFSEKYFKRSRPRESLAKFEAWRPNSKSVKAVISKDPILKSHPKLEKEIVKHEIREVKSAYTKNSKLKNSVRMAKSHREAKSQEPPWLRKEIRKLRISEAKINPNWKP